MKIPPTVTNFFRAPTTPPRPPNITIMPFARALSFSARRLAAAALPRPAAVFPRPVLRSIPTRNFALSAVRKHNELTPPRPGEEYVPLPRKNW
jgi:hypothetical protein